MKKKIIWRKVLLNMEELIIVSACIYLASKYLLHLNFTLPRQIFQDLIYK